MSNKLRIVGAWSIGCAVIGAISAVLINAYLQPALGYEVITEAKLANIGDFDNFKDASDALDSAYSRFVRENRIDSDLVRQDVTIHVFQVGSSHEPTYGQIEPYLWIHVTAAEQSLVESGMVAVIRQIQDHLIQYQNDSRPILLSFTTPPEVQIIRADPAPPLNATIFGAVIGALLGTLIGIIRKQITLT